MKSCILFLILVLIVLNENFAQIKNGFIISGYIKNIGETKVLLGNKPIGYPTGFELKYFDSCFSKNDSFYFKGQVKEPAFYSIEIPEKSKGWCSFILENEAIEIRGNKDSVWKAVIEGSRQTKKYFSYRNLIDRPIQKRITDISIQMEHMDPKKDSVKISQLKNDSLKYYSNLVQTNLFNYISLHPEDYVSLYELYYLRSRINADSAKKYYMLLAGELKQNSLGKRLYYELYEIPENIKVFKKLPNFSLPDTSGDVIEMTSFRGKYVIIDFWASWCGPCIAEFRGIKKLYSAYPHEKLAILGISLDSDKPSWINSIQKNELNWYQLSDLHGNNNKAALLFGIEFIPQKFLIDPNGIILLTNSSTDQIREELDKLIHTNP